MPSDDRKKSVSSRKKRKSRSRSNVSRKRSHSKEQKSKISSSNRKKSSTSPSRIKSSRKHEDRRRRSTDRRSKSGDRRSRARDNRREHCHHRDRHISLSRHNDIRHRSRSSSHHNRTKERSSRRDKLRKTDKSSSPKPFMVPTSLHKSNPMLKGSYILGDRNSYNSKFPFQLNASASNQKDQRKRKSRWTESETGRIYIPGLPTTLPPNLSPEQERAYILQLQIEEMSRRLRLPNLGIPENPLLRSPSPEPVYDQFGKRTNTRDARTRKKLEDDRHLLILEMYKLNPEYKPPLDYKPQLIRFTDKVDIPQDDFPEINFVGLLIGPRGNSLKNLEKETGAKIIIRGKGSVKDGKLARKEAGPLPGEDEPLHAYITGTTLDIVEGAKKRISEIIQNGIEVPESMNELRRQQLRELALLNGTLRENECLNKLKILTEAETIVTNTIICPICGGAGHIANDCMLRGSLTKEQLEKIEKECVDTEYSALMKELGHNVAATQLKCLSSIICTGALTSGLSGLALPASETIETKTNENGETEITLVTSLGKITEDFNEDDIPPLMPSGHLVVNSSFSQCGFASKPTNQTMMTNSEDATTSFFTETAQKWINDSVYTDPTMAIAAAALSQYAYHPLSASMTPAMPTNSYWPYPGYGGTGMPPCMPPAFSTQMTFNTNRWYSPTIPISSQTTADNIQPSNTTPQVQPPPPPPPPPPPSSEAI